MGENEGKKERAARKKKAGKEWGQEKENGEKERGKRGKRKVEKEGKEEMGRGCQTKVPSDKTEFQRGRRYGRIRRQGRWTDDEPTLKTSDFRRDRRLPEF